MKEALKIAGYRYLKCLGDKWHLLLNIATNKVELFFSNKNHLGWALIYKSTHLEYVSTVENIDSFIAT